MNPLRLLRIWLLALVVVLVGCGGHDDVDVDLPDVASDRRTDVASDRVADAIPTDGRDAGGDVPADVRVDAVADVRVDTIPDTRIDTVDARIDTADVRIDTIADIRVDLRIDAVADIRVDTDVRTDVRIDTPDVRIDVPPPPIDVTTDPDVDAGCASDNQCGGLTPHCNTNTGNCVGLVAIAVTPASTSIAAGTTQQFTATITYSDASTGNVTALAQWASSNTAVATMSSSTAGLASGVAPGPTTISAVYSGLAAGTQLTVTAALLNSIQITPSNASSPLGTTRQFTATGTYSDNSTQDLTSTTTWASSVPGFATIAAGGLATTVAIGSTQISATTNGVTGVVMFTVTSPTLTRIDVSPPSATIATLTTQDYTATGVYSDNSTIVLVATWVSSDTAIATMSGTTATGISAGTTTISATFGGVTGSTPLTVTGATLTSIDVTPASPSAPIGYNVQFRAIGNFSSGPPQDLTADVLWDSLDDAQASISNASGSEGLAAALQRGTSTISATIAGVTGSTVLTITNAALASIEVTPATPSIALGTKQQFTAIAHFMDGSSLAVTEQASWSSSALGVATVSNAAGSRGLASSVAGGAATITAALSGANGSATLTVTPATLVSIAVTPIATSTTVGLTVPFTAIGTYSDASTQNITALVIWSSTDPGVATISTGGGTEGVANAVATGDTTIQATQGSVMGSTTLHVDP